MSKESKDLTYEETYALLIAPWKKGTVAIPIHYGDATWGEGTTVKWKTYHNDTDYISILLEQADGTPIVEFTETPDRIKEAME